jgi:azurin
LNKQRARLVQLTSSSIADVRSATWAALALADGSFDQAWTTAVKAPESLADLLQGIPRLPDPEFRGKAYDKTLPLLTALPSDWKAVGQSAKGRYVRIELPRKGTLTLAEVQVFSAGQNVALQGKAKQSSLSNSGDPNRAIDGKISGNYGSGTLTHTQENGNNPWWEVDLGSEKSVESIAIWNRTESNLGERLEGFTLVVLDGSRREVFKKINNPAPKESVTITVSSDVLGLVRQSTIQALVSMNREPEAVFGALSRLISEGKDVTTAARGIRVLPRANWPKAEAGKTAEALTAWAKTIPVADRTSQDYIETIQVANDLASVLPAAQSTPLRKELKTLSISVFVVRTVVEQMRFDTPRLVVEAGKPFEVIIENADFMPHNFVVVKPGAREKIGNTTAAMQPDQFDAQGRPFVPKTADVIAATKLLEPGTRETLKLTAPTQEGVYEYVCTYPGHWMLMWGQLVVTKDVEDYLQKNPEVKLNAAAVKE